MKFFKTICALFTAMLCISSCASDHSLVESVATPSLKVCSNEDLAIATAEALDVVTSTKQTETRVSPALDKSNNEVASKMEAACAPLVEVGQNVAKEVMEVYLLDKTSFELTDEEMAEICALDVTQSAEVGFLVSMIENEDFFLETYGRQITSAQILECLITAIGIDDITDIINIKDTTLWKSIEFIKDGTTVLMNAKSMTKILKALGKRTLGWIGVAYMMYDFSTCINKAIN
jgi:hypothetical protein